MIVGINMLLYRLIVYLLLCGSFSNITTKLLIFSYSHNRPEFIEIQYKTFNKFLMEDYKFIVFNDASTENMAQEISDTCQRLGISSIRIPQGIHTYPYLPRWPGESSDHPTVRNVNVVQYSLHTIGFHHDDILLLLDSDIFLVKRFNAHDFLAGYDIGGRLLKIGARQADEIADKNEITYLWHGLAFLDLRTLPNIYTLSFNCGKVEDRCVDAGGHSYYYLKHNPAIKRRFINHNFSNELSCDMCRLDKLKVCTHNKSVLEARGLNNSQIQLCHTCHDIEFFHDNTFMHYRAGSNWNYKSEEYHRNKTLALSSYINTILAS